MAAEEAQPQRSSKQAEAETADDDVMCAVHTYSSPVIGGHKRSRQPAATKRRRSLA